MVHKKPTWRCRCETMKSSLDNVVEDIVGVYSFWRLFGDIFVKFVPALSFLGSSHWHLPYTSFCSIYTKAIDIYRQFTLYKNICYHYTNEIYLIVPSLFVITARPQCALWHRAANSFLARYAGGLYEFLFEAYLRIKFWKFSNSDVLLKLNIYKLLLYDAYHILYPQRKWAFITT
jgi:hypothetical protein